MLILFYGLHFCTLSSFNTGYYLITLNKAQWFYFEISLGQRAKSRGNQEKDNRENIATLNHFGIYKLSIYINSWKKLKQEFYSTAVENWV